MTTNEKHLKCTCGHSRKNHRGHPSDRYLVCIKDPCNCADFTARDIEPIEPTKEATPCT